MTAAPLEVRVFRGVRGEAVLERELDALNAASSRPAPFDSAGLLEAVLDHDEFAVPGQDVLLLGALDGSRLVGFLALRRVPQRTLGAGGRRLEFLITHDNDRPRLVARPEDEERVARAFCRHLLERERWSSLELVNQEEGSPLLEALARPGLGVHARRLEGLSTAVLDTASGDFRGWFEALDPSFRKNVARLGRNLFAQGQLEWLECSDPRARLPLLELYLDVERRSWKRNDGLARHPQRLALHRKLCGPDQPLGLMFNFVLLDGVAVAGTMDANFSGVRYGMETCYDESLAKAGVGHFCCMMTIRGAFASREPSFNMFGGYGYYKSNWGARLLVTTTLQLFRMGSAAWLKARLGDLRRRLRRGAAAAERFNPARRQKEPRDAAPAGASARQEERALAAQILGELATQGLAHTRLGGDALSQAVPYRSR